MVARHRQWLVCLLFLPLLGWAAPARANYRSDDRTAVPLSFRSPRAALSECVEALSRAAEVRLSVAPGLAEEPLVGYVPKRPLRETMAALAELYDGRWADHSGGYRLELDPERARSASPVRAATLALARVTIDQQADEAVRQARDSAEDGESQHWHLFAASLWKELRPSQRDRVLNGVTTTIRIPASRAGKIYELMLAISKKRPAKLAGPLLASFDLDGRPDLNGWVIRARATAMRTGSYVGAIGVLEIPASKPAAAVDTFVGNPKLPSNVGEDGQLTGDRDEILGKLAETAATPILSRHNPRLGNGVQIKAGGRRLSEVVAELADTCDATVRPAGAYRLFRSNTELLDRSGRMDAAILGAYLRRRPKTGVVPVATLAELAPLSPLQLAVLSRHYRYGSEAETAGQMFAVLRFYRSLSTKQQQKLFSPDGLLATSLTHEQIHQLLDEKTKRASFDIHDQLQMLEGLSFRFQEETEQGEHVLVLDALREGQSKSHAVQALPKVEDDEGPTAQR